MSLWLLKCDCTNIWNGFSQSEDWKTSWPRSQCFATRPPGCLISHFHVIVTCQRKNRCQTDTDSWHTPVPATFQEDVGNSGEIKWGDCWTSKGALAGKMSYCSSFNLLITIRCLQYGARRLHRLSGGGILEIVFWNQDYEFCIWYLVTSLCMDGAKDKVEQVQRQSRQEIGPSWSLAFE